MRIVLATCRTVPDWEIDDHALHEAIRRRGIDFELAPWDDAGLDWSRFDACLIRTTWDYAERRDEFVDWADRVAAATRLFNSSETVRWNTHKSYLRELETRGLPVVPTAWFERGSPADLRAATGDRGWDRGVLKPAVGATARETMRFGPGDLAPATAHLARLLRAEDMLLQPYFASVEEEGELSIVVIDGTVTHAVRKVPRPGDYRVQDDFGAADHGVSLSRTEHDLAADVLAALDATPLYARVDLLRDDEGVLRLSELELVEPLLFFRHAPPAAGALVDGLCSRLG